MTAAAARGATVKRVVGPLRVGVTRVTVVMATAAAAVVGVGVALARLVEIRGQVAVVVDVIHGRLAVAAAGWVGARRARRRVVSRQRVAAAAVRVRPQVVHARRRRRGAAVRVRVVGPVGHGRHVRIVLATAAATATGARVVGRVAGRKVSGKHGKGEKMVNITITLVSTTIID